MWSLGVICYILLSGFSPFMGDSDTDTFSNISRCVDTPPTPAPFLATTNTTSSYFYSYYSLLPSVTYDYECEEFDSISENAKVRGRQKQERSRKGTMSRMKVIEEKEYNFVIQDFISSLLKEKPTQRRTAQQVRISLKE